jgi:hypothetical protein
VKKAKHQAHLTQKALRNVREEQVHFEFGFWVTSERRRAWIWPELLNGDVLKEVDDLDGRWVRPSPYPRTPS